MLGDSDSSREGGAEMSDPVEERGNLCRQFGEDLRAVFGQRTPLRPESLRELFQIELPADELADLLNVTLRFSRAHRAGSLKDEPSIGTTAASVLASIGDPTRPSILDRADAWAAKKGRGAFDPTTSNKPNLQPYEPETLSDEERAANAAALTAGLDKIFKR